MRPDLAKREIVAEDKESFAAERLGDNHEKPGFRVTPRAMGQHCGVATAVFWGVKKALYGISIDLANRAIHLPSNEVYKALGERSHGSLNL